MPISIADYYSFRPAKSHVPGDLWSGLPMHGLLGLRHTHAIIVTPACDLDNCKVETLTYLPIVPVRRLLRSVALAKAIKKEIRRLMELGVGQIIEWPDDMTLPPLSEVRALRDKLARVEGLNSDAAQAVDRAGVALFCLDSIIVNDSSAISSADLAVVLGNRYNSMVSEIVRNQRQDTHFLPRDLEPIVVAAVPEHSAVLFRYPLTTPLELLDMANVGNTTSWGTSMTAISHTFPIAAAFREEMPLKRGQLLNPFLSDLITRYVATYARLGSPDFTAEQISSFCREITR